MRTTLNIDDDVLEYAKQISDRRHVSVGEAISQMARDGMERPVELRLDPLTGLLVVHHPAGTPVLTSAEVYRLQAEEDFDKSTGEQ